MLCNIKPVPFHESDKHIFAKIPGGIRTPGSPPPPPPPPPGSAHGVIVWEWDKDSFKGYNAELHYILKTITTGYPAFQFRPSNSEHDINLTDFHYSRPSNEIIMLHILCTRRFFFVLVCNDRNVFNVLQAIVVAVPVLTLYQTTKR